MTAIAASPILRPEREPRSKRFWLAVLASVVLHVLVFGAWLLFGSGGASKVPPPATMDVTIADDIGLKAGAPNTTVDPAESKAPEIAKPADSAPPPTPTVERAEPAPPRPQPEAAPPPKPTAVAKPQSRTVSPPSPKPAKVVAKPAPAAPAKPVVAPGKGTGKAGTSLKRPSGLSFDNSYFKGAADKPTTATGNAPKAATLTAAAVMDITKAIERQIQPCVDRQPRSGLGPGAEDIFVTFHLRFDSDGRLSTTPQRIRVRGVNPTNQPYVGRVGEIGINALKQCSPLKLPAQYYQTPTGGWSDINYTYNWRAR